MDIEFFTTEELVKELTKRKTFIGLVIYSPKELRAKRWGEKPRSFKLKAKNLNRQRIVNLLNSVSVEIKKTMKGKQC